MSHPLEFIGMIAHRAQSEIHPPQGAVVDPGYIRRFAQAHEAAGFDRILVAWGSTSPDALLVTTHAAAATDRIGFMVAHRPGFIAPTVAARQFATLDQLSGGRAAIHVISGGSPTEQRKDGDWLSHDERYARSEEYVAIMHRLWTASKPFDHQGKYYRFEGGYSEVKPVDRIPIFFGGSSDVAIDIAGRIADTYAFWGESRPRRARPRRDPLQPVLPSGAGRDRGSRLGARRPHHRPHPRTARRCGRRWRPEAGKRRVAAAAGGRRRRPGA